MLGTVAWLAALSWNRETIRNPSPVPKNSKWPLLLEVILYCVGLGAVTTDESAATSASYRLQAPKMLQEASGSASPTPGISNSSVDRSRI